MLLLLKERGTGARELISPKNGMRRRSFRHNLHVRKEKATTIPMTCLPAMTVTVDWALKNSDLPAIPYVIVTVASPVSAAAGGVDMVRVTLAQVLFTTRRYV